MDTLDDEGAKCLDIESPTCTVCGKNLVLQKNALCAHPSLNVIVCKACNNFYKRSSFSKDENGIDNSCRWCGNGGDLICCDTCPNAFHKKCIARNVSDELFNKIAYSDEWACFGCDPSPISHLVDFCKKVLDHLNKMPDLEVSTNSRSRKPFLSPNSKMPPKVAMGRCIENALQRSKVFRDVISQIRQKLDKSNSTSEIKIVGERFRNCIMLSNETNESIVKSVNRVLENLHSVSETNKQPGNLNKKMIKEENSISDVEALDLNTEEAENVVRLSANNNFKDKHDGLKLSIEDDSNEEDPVKANSEEKLKIDADELKAIKTDVINDSDDEKLVDIAKRKNSSIKLKLDRMKRRNRPMPKSAKARQVESEEEFETCDEGSSLNKSGENCDLENTAVDSEFDKKVKLKDGDDITEDFEVDENTESDKSSKPIIKKTSKVLKNSESKVTKLNRSKPTDVKKGKLDESDFKAKKHSEILTDEEDQLGESCSELKKQSKNSELIIDEESKLCESDLKLEEQPKKSEITDEESKTGESDFENNKHFEILTNEKGKPGESDFETNKHSEILTDEEGKPAESDSETTKHSEILTDEESKSVESDTEAKKHLEMLTDEGDKFGESDPQKKKLPKKSKIITNKGGGEISEGNSKGKKLSKKSKLGARDIVEKSMSDDEKISVKCAASDELIAKEGNSLEEKITEGVLDSKLTISPALDDSEEIIESSLGKEEEINESTAESFKQKLFSNLILDETNIKNGNKEDEEESPRKSKDSEEEDFTPKSSTISENFWNNEAEDLEKEIAERLQNEKVSIDSPEKERLLKVESESKKEKDSDEKLILDTSTSKPKSVEEEVKKTPRSLALRKKESPETIEKKKLSEDSIAKNKQCLFASSDEESDSVKNKNAKFELLKMLGEDSENEEEKSEESKSKKSKESNAKREQTEETSVNKSSTDGGPKKSVKKEKFEQLLKSINDSSEEILEIKSKKSDGLKSPRKMKSTPKNDFELTLDDPKFKMKAIVVVKKMEVQEIKFILKNGVKAYKKKLRGLNSEDEEFLRACDFRSLRGRKKNLKANADESDESNNESDIGTKAIKKRPVRGAKKKNSRIDNLLSGSESSGESDHKEDGKQRLESSDSEPTFKTAEQLAKESLLKELATTTSEDEDNDADTDEFDSNKSTNDKASKKTNKNSKRKVSSESDEWKKYDSEDDFVPVKKNRRLRSKLTSNDSDSDDSAVGKKGNKKRRRDSDGDIVSTSSVTSAGSKKKSGKRKRRRIKVASSTDSSVQEISGDDLQNTPGSKGRKNIRKLISDRKLTSDTKAAAREEDERKKRVAELQKLYNEEFREEGEKGMRVTTKLKLAENKETGEVIEVSDNLIRKLKPHQVEGVKFMWECVGESLERLDTTPGSGCILAHCMGLGKTLQVITFLHTILTREKDFPRTALVVCPLNIVLNWYHECSQWLDDVQPSITVLEMSRFKTHPDRAVTLKNWYKSGGILIIGYDMFRNLVQENSKRIPKTYRDIFHAKLIDPGPDIVVCDEGHILKNANTGISKAMTRIATKRRIILTGTPLQNNLTEYHCMVNFVKQNLLGNMKEFQNRFVNPISNGQHTDSTSADVRVMKNRAHVLHTLLDGCVQRRDYNVLTPFLPPKYEYVIDIRLTEIQIKLYTFYLENMCSRLHGKAQLFADYQNLMKIWTHPRVIRLAEIRQENKISRLERCELAIDVKAIPKIPNQFPLARHLNANNDSLDSFIDDNSDSSSADGSVILDDSDSDKPGTSKKSKNPSDTEDVVNKWKTRSRSKNISENNEEGKTGMDEESLDSAPLNTWWTGIISEDDAKKVEHSGKLLILFDILKQCEEIGDKVLLFSQSLLSLDFIESIINGDDPVIGNSIPHECKMVRGFDYFRLDGSTSAENRSKFTKMFNNKKNLRARLFLISTKAGSLGINLVAANRVIIFDASWNPTHDIQSIFRVYRFGQVKPVYIYRFVSHGTMEEKIYDRQVTKQSLACRVIDEQQIERHFSFADLQELYSFQPENVKKRSTPVLPKDKLLADLLSNRKELIVSYHEHDSLLVNVEGEELTEDERICAWVEYNFDRSIINAEGLYGFDIHKEVQELQKQFPGLNDKELSSKLNEKVDAMVQEARIQRQKQQQLLLQHKLQMQQNMQQNMQHMAQQNMQHIIAQQNLQQMAQQNLQHLAQQSNLHGIQPQGNSVQNMTPAQYQQLMNSVRQMNQQKYLKNNDTRHHGKIDLNQLKPNQSFQNTVTNVVPTKPKTVLKPLDKPFR